MKSEILKFFKGDVEDGEEELVKYSHDASLFEIKPKLILFPKNSLDIQNLVLWVKEKKESGDDEYKNLSITTRSAGTDMSGGPLNDSIILDVTKYMNKMEVIKKISAKKILPHFINAKEVEVVGEVTTMPGVFYRDFEVKTKEMDLILPSYTASKSINTVGGMAANNSAGELTLKYGQTCDYIKEMKVVFADGHEYIVKPLKRRELYSKIAQVDFEGKVYKQIFDLIEDNKTIIDSAKPKVSKNSAGYYLWNVMKSFPKGTVENNEDEIFDLCQIIVGSQGTLGIITEVTYYLVEEPRNPKLVTVFLKDLKNLGNIIDDILEFSPTTLESYDDKTFSLAMKFFPDLVKSKGVWETIKFGLAFIPEFMMVVFGGVPKLILLVEFSGADINQNLKNCRSLEKKLKKYNLKTRTISNEKEANKYWAMRRDSFALLRKHVQGRRTAPFIDDIIVPPQTLPEFLPQLNNLFDNYPSLIYTIAGHAGNGNLHIIPLMDFNDPKSVPIILELSKKVYELVIKYDGSITAEHNDGLIRTPFLPMMYGENMTKLFKETKEIFDSKCIFNPKKKVGATMEDIAKYIIKPDAPHVTHSS